MEVRTRTFTPWTPTAGKAGRVWHLGQWLLAGLTLLVLTCHQGVGSGYMFMPRSGLCRAGAPHRSRTLHFVVISAA